MKSDVDVEKTEMVVELSCSEREVIEKNVFFFS